MTTDARTDGRTEGHWYFLKLPTKGRSLKIMTRFEDTWLQFAILTYMQLCIFL